MDMALDEVSIHATPHFFHLHLPRRSCVIWPNADYLWSQIVAANRPKGVRRSSRRGGAKSQVLGHAPSNPSTRAKAAPASAGAKTVTAAATQSSEKIIVSGLPVDVTEQQVKVRSNTSRRFCLVHTDSFVCIGALPLYRWPPPFSHSPLRRPRSLKGCRRSHLLKERRRQQGSTTVPQSAH